MSPMFPRDSDKSDASDIKWYAGLAMQAIIVKQTSVPDTSTEREEIALWAFRMGQAMASMENSFATTSKNRDGFFR